MPPRQPFSSIFPGQGGGVSSSTLQPAVGDIVARATVPAGATATCKKNGTVLGAATVTAQGAASYTLGAAGPLVAGDQVSFPWTLTGETPATTATNAPVALSISGADGTANVGDTASFTPTISGGTAPYTVTATGLPPGRAIQTPSTGLTTGAYTTAGSYSATYTVRDNVGATASFTRSVVVSAVTGISAAIVVLAGQSNGVVNGVSGSTGLPAAWGTTTRVKYWTGSAFVTYDPAAQTNWGPEVNFAVNWLSANPGGTLYLVKTNVASTQLGAIATYGAANGNNTGKDWAPATAAPNGLFQVTTAALNAAKAAAPTGTPVTDVIWMQGEQDAQNQPLSNDYGTNLTALYTAIRSAWGTSSTRILAGGLNSSGTWTNSGIIRPLQQNVAFSGANNRYVSTVDLALSDTYHFTAASVNIVAQRLWNSIAGGSAYESGYTPTTFTPASTTKLLRLGSLNGLTETVDGSGYDYVGAANRNYPSGQFGVSILKIPAGQDGSAGCILPVALTSGQNGPVIGLSTSPAAVSYNAMDNFVAVNNGSFKVGQGGGVGNPANNTFSQAAGDVISVRRTGQSIYVDLSKDNGQSYTTIHTFAPMGTSGTSDVYMTVENPTTLCPIKLPFGSTNMA